MEFGMSKAVNPRKYLGVRANNPPEVVLADAAPATTDTQYEIGDIWVDKTAFNSYELVGFSSGAAQWAVLGGSTSAVATITGDSGSAAVPVSGNLNVLGTAADGLSFASASPTGDDITGSIAAATTSQRGTLETATDAEALAKSSTAVALTPSNLAASGFLQYADVTITAAEVKALATTPIELVAAPAAGSAHQFMGAIFKLNYGSEVFAEAGDNLGVKYTNAAGVQVSSTVETTGFIDQSADTQTNAIPAQDAIVASSAAEAQALVLDNLNANITGNASNDSTVTVRTYYVTQAL
jgi:hypothetical protein